MIEAEGLRVYTMSELMRYLECPQMYNWDYEQRLVPKNNLALPLNVGSAVHYGIERMLAGSSNPVGEAMMNYLEATAAHWVDAPEGSKKWQELVKGREQIEASLKAYPWTAADFASVTEVETAFILPMGKGRAYSGKWDRVVKMPDGRLYLHDTKTTGERVDFVVQKHRMRMQYKAYCFAYYAIHGERPAGFIMDFIVKPRVNFKRDGSLSSVSDAGFHREPMVITDRDYDYFPKWFHRVVESIEWDREVERDKQGLHPANPSTPWPQNSEACGNWNRLCSFYDLCRANSDKMVAAMKEAMFDVKDEIHGQEYLNEASLQALAWMRRAREDAEALAKERSDEGVV